MPVSGSWGNPETRRRPLFPLRRASPFFSEHPLEGRHVQRQLGDDVLQSPVFILEHAQLLGVAHVHAAVLGFPAIEALLADPMPPAQVLRLGSSLGLLENRDDLLLGKPLPLHVGSPLVSLWRTHTLCGSLLGEQVVQNRSSIIDTNAPPL